jgi:hypothetical protein
MNGRRLVVAFLALVAIFAVALVYFQVFAFYERTDGPGALALPVPVAAWEGIDAPTSPLKLRACFETDPAAAATLEPAPDAAPLNPPFWFRCFESGGLTEDLDAGRASAYAVARDVPDGFDLMLAVYPDGRAFLWRQLNERFR